VNVPPILQRHRALRWLAPVGVVCVASLAATGVFNSRASSADHTLPKTTPAALIAAVKGSSVSGFSGTVVSHLALGLPDLPSIGQVNDGTSFTSLLSGSHTLQVWYGGPQQERVALLGSTDETDVFRDGTELWQWSSAERRAVHVVLPARSRPSAPVALPSSLASLTPQQLARKMLAAMSPSTKVQVATEHAVADRAAYDLVLTPRTSDTKVGLVRIAVDGQTKIPLGVQVYPRQASSPAIDVSFTNIVFGAQSDRNFRFSPPSGATVTEVNGHQHSAPPTVATPPAHRKVKVHGSGWTAVVDASSGAKSFDALRHHSVLNSLTPVAGTWGKGYLLDSALLSVLVTDQGRVLAGAVPAADLYAAAAAK
jgi:outer membrane lipoprotein-sorting protein